jgi:uncharacterized SAM-binding protein YcdF (DUF218 family)
LSGVRSGVKWILLGMGVVMAIAIILAFTSLPFWTWYGMSTRYATIHRPPDVIVVLGGGGMPSESGLMRTWYGSEAANRFRNALVIIALPGDRYDSTSSVMLMRKELLLHGVAAERIILEDSGTNTRAEVLNILKILKVRKSISAEGIAIQQRKAEDCRLLLVSGPEHLYRAVKVFNKAGFRFVDGMPAFESTIEAELGFDKDKLGGRKWVPDIGKNITLRYRFWTQLHYEQTIVREWFALAYYKLNGWI